MDLFSLLLLLSPLVASGRHVVRTRRSSPFDVTADWNGMARADLAAATRAAQQLNENAARNVILFLGDGMGQTSVTAARVFKAQKDNTPLDETHFAFDRFPHVALSKTYNTDRYTADSAGTATAFLCGVKTRLGSIGVDHSADQLTCRSSTGGNVSSILKHSVDKGKWTGVVTTTRITHATPAASYAHAVSRNWEHDGAMPEWDAVAGCTDIAYQLVHGAANKHIRVALGGGRQMFMPNASTDNERGTPGYRTDGRNLTDDWIEIKLKELGAAEDRVKYVEDDEQFKAVDPARTDYLLGLFDASHMQYETDRMNASFEQWGEPSLAEMTAKAIEMLKRGPEGYFLLVEGGRIDHAHHGNRAYKAMNDVLAFDDAIQKALSISDESETLIVVTADHSHAFSMVGYPDFETPVMGLVHETGKGSERVLMLADDNKPYTVLGYINGPGQPRAENETELRANLTDVDTTDPQFRQPGSIPMSDETHGGEDVSIFATGPMSHMFHSTHEQSYVAHVMMYASCVGSYSEDCPGFTSGATYPASGSASGLVVIVVLLMFQLGRFVRHS